MHLSSSARSFSSAPSPGPTRCQTLFITATDTGVGKTLLTGLLLQHLRQHGSRTLALKPFCSGSRADVELLYTLQDGELSRDEINPFFFRQPLAPLVAARKQHRSIPLDQVLHHIRTVQERLTETALDLPHQPSSRRYLLIEGIGGLFVPLGPGYTVADLIARLACQVIVVAPNRLGTINHTLLTVRALQLTSATQALPAPPTPSSQTPQAEDLSVVLMHQAYPDISAKSNPKTLAGLVAPVSLIEVPFLGAGASRIQSLKNSCKKIKKTLALILR